MVTPAAHREAAVYLQQTYEMSQRRACRAIVGDRSSVRYQARRADDGELRERLKETGRFTPARSTKSGCRRG